MRPHTTLLAASLLAATAAAAPAAGSRHDQGAMGHGAMGHGTMGDGTMGHGAMEHAAAAEGADTPATREFKVAHAQMMRGMGVAYTGDPDVDFRLQMIPHHQGAIDMAKVALRRAKDPWTRQLAEAVVVEQQREIAEMRAWLARRGVAAPAAQPTHVMSAQSYRTMAEEPGTRAEARGQSWAPGSGIR